MPPAPFSSRRLSFKELGASILATWGTILAPHKHLGSPWEQQDGHEVVQNRIFKDFGSILGPHSESFLGTEA